MKNTNVNEVNLESVASEYVGKIVFAFSRLELELNFCLQWAVHAKEFYTVNPLVDRLSFKNKTDALIEIIEIKFISSPECISEFKSWHRKIDKYRIKRNSFIHGRWGFFNHQEVVNVAPGTIGSNERKETRYDILALKQELEAIEAISNEFNNIRQKWHI